MYLKNFKNSNMSSKIENDFLASVYEMIIDILEFKLNNYNEFIINN